MSQRQLAAPADEHKFYFLINAGHATGHFWRPVRLEDRPAWNAWLKGAAAVLACTGAFALFLAYGSSNRPLEATVQMERLAAKVERAKAIDPATAHEIARLIGQPWYDCNQVACSAQMQARNGLARDRLQTLMARKTPGEEIGAVRKREAAVPDAATIGSRAISVADQQ